MKPDWRNEPATEEQKEKLRFFGCTSDEGITTGQASDSLEECAKQFPDIEAAFQEAKAWIELCKISYPVKPQNESSQEVTIQEAVKPQDVSPREYIIPACEAQSFSNQQANEETILSSQGLETHIADLKSGDKHVRDRAVMALGQSKNHLAVKPLIASLADSYWGVRIHAARALGELGFPEAVEALIGALRDSELYVRKEAAEALGKIKDIRALGALEFTLRDRVEYVRKAAAVAYEKIKGSVSIPAIQDYTPSSPAIRKVAAYQIAAPIERFTKLLDGFLERTQTCIDDHCLPVGPLSDVFASEVISIGLCRQIADTIESRGYCVEPDARFGNGTYDRDQTLALFKPFDGDSIRPSTAYHGAANLLRLCVLIATADGQIDHAELDVFRQVIENQLDLSQTDHQRLIVLERLLTQDPSSARRTLAKVAKAVPAHKRLLIGRVLVRVAATDHVITKRELRALERIFKAFQLQPHTIEKLLQQAYPPQQEAKLQGAETGTSGERIPERVVTPAPQGFKLDMSRVHAIANETREVVGILSVVMQDEQEEASPLPKTVAATAPEISQASNNSDAKPEPRRFDGLDAALCIILERLLTRDSWPRADFNALAREFHFMPLNIHDTLNEWADEVLGDFILDGEDPVVIRRELISKETI